MHIIQIAPYYPPYLGGQEKYVFDLSHELVRLGHQVTVLTSDVPSGSAFQAEAGVNIHRFHCWARPLRNPFMPGMLFSSHIPADADILHAHNIHSFTSNVAILLRHQRGVPLVLTSHGKLVFGSRFPDLAVKLYMRTLGRATVRGADRVIALTPSERLRIAQETGTGKDKIEVVPVGIDLRRWDELRMSPLSQIRPPELIGRKVILVATQLIRRKGIQYLIRAMTEVVAHFPESLLAIAGRGDHEAFLYQLVSDLGLEKNVTFYGLLTSDQLARLYQASSLFVLPSLGEGQPPCIMEAWVFSKPVIATQIEGVRDYFSAAARLVAPADPAALADGILEVMGNESLAAEMGKKGRTLVESFTLERIAALMVDVYDRVLREGRRA